MRISYILDSQSYSYDQDDKETVEDLNFLLTNNKGDFLNLGIEKNTCKYQGMSICNPKDTEVYKVIDSISLEALETKEAEYAGHYVNRKFKSSLIDGEDGVKTVDHFYLGPTGGMYYEVSEYEGDITIDLDCRKRDDFDEWGRFYKTYKKDDLLLVRYTKKNEEKQQYELFFAIKGPNFSYDLLEEWVEKEYPFSQRRNSLHKRYVFRLLKGRVEGNQKLIIAAGFDEDEVLKQIYLLEGHKKELETFDKDITDEVGKLKEFGKPLTHDVLLSYRLSNNAVYRFLNKELDAGRLQQGSFAGFPWFSNIWARDELISLKALMLNGEEEIVKERLMYYLDSIDENTGMMKRIDEEGSYQSADGVFWLGKRLEEFIFYLDEHQKLYKAFTLDEIKNIYRKLNLSFNRIIKNSWNKDMELLNVKYGDSWMDTIDVEFPLDIQVQLLEYISVLGIIAGLLDRKDDAQKFLDLENGLRENIREKYLRDEMILYNEPHRNVLNSNVFLAFYIYKDLFLLEDWERIFDNALRVLKTDWGGIRSLSREDPQYQDNYTGENNLSYHRGDVWYWVNNITAMALFEVNEKKYRKTISEIVLASTKDILRMGTIGFASEVSSASSQKAQGCMAQLWSSATYVEMIEKMYERK